MTDDRKFTKKTVPQTAIKPGLSLITVAGKDIILIRQGNLFTAFENRCPHRNKALFSHETPIDFDRYHLQCQHHGAIFELPHGACISGPCPSDKLTAITVTYSTTEITLYLDDHRNHSSSN
ncbi:Rieske (2Fe-2S) protein [uncultured Umboniibacter sp.]|uniref:Rieske (2Fe-2S) protein n=1 Tax=uncultured Umboniibacter sp. TaxID=1798917 RepID=UPI00262ABBB9|nr:Rieske (2Fe-2S) protein [uncultured Umboniibacter sp.]